MERDGSTPAKAILEDQNAWLRRHLPGYTLITSSQEIDAFRARSARDLKGQVVAKVADWRATLRQETHAARQVLRQLIADRIALEATEHDGQRVYRYTGAFTIGGVFEGFLRPQAVASPSIPSWNQIVSFLRQMAELQDIASSAA